MNPKNTWLLVALAAGLFAFIWLIEPRLRPPPPVAPRVMPDFKPADVTSVQIQTKGQLVRVERTNGTWLMTQPLIYPVKAAAVENFLAALRELSPRPRISVEELRKVRNVGAEYGLDAPQATITVEFGGDDHNLLLGSRTPNGDELYVQPVGRDWVDVVSAGFLKFVPRDAGDWRDTKFVNLAGLDFDRLSVIHGDKVIELARDTTNKLWRMTGPAARADNPKIENLLSSLRSLRVSKFVTDDPDPANSERYGLQHPALELAFGQATNRLFSLQFGNSPSNDNSLVYARSNAQNTIVLLPRDLVAGWPAERDDFRDRHLLDLVSYPPDQIEVSNEETFKVVLTNGFWMVTDAQNQSYPADGALMGAFLEYLARLQVVPQSSNHFYYQDVANAAYLNDDGLLAPRVRSYVLEHNAPPASTNEVDFGIITNGYILARRTDESSVVAVDPEAFKPLPVRAIQLRERRVWYFDAADVTRLSVRNSGKTQTWVHDGTNDWMLASSPTNRDLMPNRVANSLTIEQAAGNLGELRVEAWVERGDTNRAKYGIGDTTPRITLEVKRGDISKTFSIDFGRPSEDQRGLYASVPVFEGQNWTNWIIVYSAGDVGNLVAWLPGLQ